MNNRLRALTSYLRSATQEVESFSSGGWGTPHPATPAESAAVFALLQRILVAEPDSQRYWDSTLREIERTLGAERAEVCRSFIEQAGQLERELANRRQLSSAELLRRNQIRAWVGPSREVGVQVPEADPHLVDESNNFDEGQNSTDSDKDGFLSRAAAFGSPDDGTCIGPAVGLPAGPEPAHDDLAIPTSLFGGHSPERSCGETSARSAN